MSLEDYESKDLHTHIFDTPDTYVGGCDKIDDASFLVNCKKLFNLNLEDCSALKTLPDLSHCKDLERLALHGSGLTEEALDLIRELPVPHIHIDEYV